MLLLGAAPLLLSRLAALPRGADAHAYLTCPKPAMLLLRAAPLLLSLLAALPRGADAHAYLTCPKPRQYRGKPATVNNRVHGWTKWVGLVVPGSGDYMEGEGNAPNLNAAIGGGGANADKGSTAGGHGLCGDLGGRNGFMAGGPYGPTPPRGVYTIGEPMEVRVTVSAYHAGWFEFRLAKPDPAHMDPSTTTPITQDMLNQHVLAIDPSTPHYSKVTDYANMGGIKGDPGMGGEYKCKYPQGAGRPVDPKSTTPNAKW